MKKQIIYFVCGVLTVLIGGCEGSDGRNFMGISPDLSDYQLSFDVHPDAHNLPVKIENNLSENVRVGFFNISDPLLPNAVFFQNVQVEAGETRHVLVAVGTNEEKPNIAFLTFSRQDGSYGLVEVKENDPRARTNDVKEWILPDD